MNDNRVTVRFNRRKDAAIINKIKELDTLGWGAGSDWIREALRRMLEYESGQALAISNHYNGFSKPTIMMNQPINDVSSPVFINETAVTEETFDEEVDEIEARFRLLNQD